MNWKQGLEKVFICCLVTKSCPTLFVTPWAHRASLSMGFPRQEYWSGLPFPSPGDLPDPRTEPASPALAGGFFTSEPPGKPIYFFFCSSTIHNNQKVETTQVSVSEWMIECRTGWDSEQKVFLKIGKLLFNCFPRGSVVKIHLPMQEMQVWSLGQEDPQEKEMATHCSILAWEVSWTEEPGRLPSMGSQKSRTQLNN